MNIDRESTKASPKGDRDLGPLPIANPRDDHVRRVTGELRDVVTMLQQRAGLTRAESFQMLSLILLESANSAIVCERRLS